MRRTAGALAALLVITFLVGAGGLATARAVPAVTVVATVAGQPLGTSSQNQPVKLFPRESSILAITVTNNGLAPIDIQEVRLEGQVIGLTFFAYDTAVSIPVAPGATASQRLVLDLSGLSGQATGLIPGAVQVLDGQHHVLAQQNGVVDVRGSLRSVYGLFGLGVAFLTVLSFLGALLGLARHRLQANRWRRGLRFLTPGIGLGLVANFTLSATRVFVPAIGRWATITFLCAVVFFGLGYLTPTPDLEDDQAEPIPTEVVEEYTVVAIAAGPRRPALAPEEPVPALAPGLTADAPPDARATLPVGFAPARGAPDDPNPPALPPSATS
jgi:hypothetical protein